MYKLLSKTDGLLLIILSITTLLLRIPLINKYLYEWDSASYALGLQNYSIAHEQPQSPGYIFYIALGKLVNFFFNDPNTTFIVLGIVFSILTVFVVYFLAKNLFGREVAVATSILLIFNPLFWFYGEIGSIYILQAFFSALIAFLCYKSLKEGDKYLYLSALVLGISGGFRLDMVVLLLPLWIFSLVYNKIRLVKSIKALSLLVIGVLSWMIPTVISTGSIGSYLELLSTVSSAGYTSILLGASLSSQIINSGLAIVWYLLAINLIGLVILVLFFFLHLGGWRKKFAYLKDPKSIFFMLWILPAFLFFTIIYIIKPGYVLISLPPIVIILGYMVKRLALDLHLKIPKISVKSIFIIILTVGVILNSIVYLYPYDLHQGELWETPQANLTESQKVLYTVNIGLMYNQEKISANDANTMMHIDVINNLSKGDPNSSILVIRDITREDEGLNWRKAMYYLPGYNVYYLFDSENSHRDNEVAVWWGKNHTDQKSESSSAEINLDPSVTRIIWIMSNETNFYNEVQSQENLNTIILSNGLKIYYTDVGDGPVNFTVSGFTFKR